MSSTYIKQEIKPPVISGIWYQGEYRRSGATTRLADKYIQDLFNNGSVVTIDHYKSELASKLLFKIVVDRLHREHGAGRFHIDKERLKIKIV